MNPLDVSNWSNEENMCLCALNQLYGGLEAMTSGKPGKRSHNYGNHHCVNGKTHVISTGPFSRATRWCPIVGKVSL